MDRSIPLCRPETENFTAPPPSPQVELGFSKRCTAPVSGSEYNFTSGRRFLDVGSSGVNDPLPNARMPSDAFLISSASCDITRISRLALFPFFFHRSRTEINNINKLIPTIFFIVIWKTIFFKFEGEKESVFSLNNFTILQI